VIDESGGKDNGEGRAGCPSGCLWAAGIVVGVMVVSAGISDSCIDVTDEDRARWAAREAAEERARAAERAEEERAEAEERRKGFHCLSAWNGSHPRFVAGVKERLNDPRSFEHVETRVTPVNPDGQHVIEMEFRARNGFGALVLNTAYGTYSPDCRGVTLIHVE